MIIEIPTVLYSEIAPFTHFETCIGFAACTICRAIDLACKDVVAGYNHVLWYSHEKCPA